LSATYTLWHESGEFLDIPALGHGTDPLDKAAGKATTYAMKNALFTYSTLQWVELMTPTQNIQMTKKFLLKKLQNLLKRKPVAPEKTVLSAIKLINLGEKTINDVENSKHYYFTSDQIERIKQETNATKKEN
jgi:hypothetical protein